MFQVLCSLSTFSWNCIYPIHLGYGPQKLCWYLKFWCCECDLSVNMLSKNCLKSNMEVGCDYCSYSKGRFGHRNTYICWRKIVLWILRKQYPKTWHVNSGSKSRGIVLRFYNSSLSESCHKEILWTSVFECRSEDPPVIGANLSYTWGKRNVARKG